MSLRLENPKNFLPLLLFIGFVLLLIGIGFLTFTSSAGLIAAGVLVMFVAVALFMLMNRGRIGF